MNTIQVIGVLTNPFGEVLEGVSIRFTSENSQGNTPKHFEAENVTNENGEYDFNLNPGTYTLEVKYSDTFEEVKSVYVDEVTPSPITLLELIDYTPEIEPVVVVPDDPIWEELHAELREDVSTTTRSKTDSLVHLDRNATDYKQLIENDRIDAHMAETNLINRVGNTEASKQTNVYEDANLNQSMQESESITTTNGSVSSSTELYDASNGKVSIVTKKEQKTPTALYAKEQNITDGDITHVEVLEGKNVESIRATQGEGTLMVQRESLQEGEIITSVETSLDQGIHNISLHSTQEGMIDINDLAQALQSRGITVYDRTLYEKQSIINGETKIEKNPDIYDITDKDGTSVFEVDTVNKEVNLNARLTITNPEDFKGEDGKLIFQVYQYSADNINWFDDWTPGDAWRRHATSTDGDIGQWSAGYYMLGQDGEDGDTYYNQYQYSTNSPTGPWHDTYIDEDMYRRWRTISVGSTPTEWQVEVMRGNNGIPGEIVSVSYQYSVNGLDPWHYDFLTGDHYRRERINYFKTAEDMLNNNPYKVEPWTSPTQIVPVDGKDYGYKYATVYLYQKSNTRPNDPSGAITYNFLTMAITGLTEGWDVHLPDGEDDVWVAVASAVTLQEVDTIAPNEWVVEKLASGGYKSALVPIYQISATKPSLPTSVLTYTFATGVVTGNLGNWSRTLPSNEVAGGRVWVTFNTAFAKVSETTDTLAVSDWAEAVIFAQNGNDGEDGKDGIDGTDGNHGSGSYIVFVTAVGDIPNNAGKDAAILSLAKRAAQAGDIISYTNSSTFNRQYLRGASVWTEFTFKVDGDAIINGTLAAEKLIAGTITGDKISANVALSAPKITGGTIGGGVLTGGQLNIGTGGLYNGYKFHVATDGKMYAQEANITGAINATSGTFAGNLSAAGGTFKGSLSAATGTFSGDISAASGTFSGTVYANKISGDIGSGIVRNFTSKNITNTTGLEIFRFTVNNSSSGRNALVTVNGLFMQIATNTSTVSSSIIVELRNGSLTGTVLASYTLPLDAATVAPRTISDVTIPTLSFTLAQTSISVYVRVRMGVVNSSAYFGAGAATVTKMRVDGTIT